MPNALLLDCSQMKKHETQRKALGVSNRRGEVMRGYDGRLWMDASTVSRKDKRSLTTAAFHQLHRAFASWVRA